MNKNYINEIDELVEIGTKNIKEKSITLNNDKPIFKKDDFNVIEGEPVYFELDELGRSSGATAILSKYTIPLVIKKDLTYPEPYGWTKSLENKGIFERCHIIAYSLSAKLADKKNIFIGTNTLNTSIMAKIERKIYKSIIKNNVRILYKVTIKYKGVDQIPTGVLIEAQSLDDDFSICEFCYNVQKNVQFNYKDGSIFKDNRLLKPKRSKPSSLLKKRLAKEKDEYNKNYIINRMTNEFHLKKSNCELIKNVEPKYLNETTATERDLIKAGLTICKKCNNSL